MSAEIDVDMLEEAFDDIAEAIQTIKRRVRQLRETLDACVEDESEDE